MAGDKKPKMIGFYGMHKTLRTYFKKHPEFDAEDKQQRKKYAGDSKDTRFTSASNPKRPAKKA